MSSEVDICNLALGFLGDDATVASIDPPEGSNQADHCARFYPMARDLVLDGFTWKFAMRRAALAPLNEIPGGAWRYAYALPSDVLEITSVVPAWAPDNDTRSCQPFTVETDATGTTVLYTNQLNAVLRYTAKVTDTTKFSPTLVVALAMQLASLLAGPVLKGETGIKAAALWADRADKKLRDAKSSDANETYAPVEHTPTWIACR